MLQIGLIHYLLLSVVLLGIGLLTIVLKRNAIGILMGVELILNAANISFVASNYFGPANARMDGYVFALFVIILAAAEAAVALAIFLNFYNNIGSIDVERASTLQG